jgi:lysyl-tRNA synthetase class I
MARNQITEKKKCKCYNCGKVTQRTYNFTLQKWAREFKCKCGSESFRWYNF